MRIRTANEEYFSPCAAAEEIVRAANSASSASSSAWKQTGFSPSSASVHNVFLWRAPLFLIMAFARFKIDLVER